MFLSSALNRLCLLAASLGSLALIDLRIAVMLRVGTASGWARVGMPSELHGVLERTFNQIVMETDNQTQLRLTTTDLDVHPGIYARVNEVSRASTTGSTVSDLLCHNT